MASLGTNLGSMAIYYVRNLVAHSQYYDHPYPMDTNCSASFRILLASSNAAKVHLVAHSPAASLSISTSLYHPKVHQTYLVILMANHISYHFNEYSGHNQLEDANFIKHCLDTKLDLLVDDIGG